MNHTPFNRWGAWSCDFGLLAFGPRQKGRYVVYQVYTPNTDSVLGQSSETEGMTKQKIQPWRNLAHFLNGITDAPALEKCIAWADGLCEAIQDAHDEGKAYGWLVPQRISFRAEGELQFSFQLSLTPMQVGQWYPNIENDAFFPPELEYHPLCYESDVFGVASLLYTLLVGYPPEFLPPPPLGEGEEEQEFFHELSQVLQHALMPEPELRYHDLFAFRGALYYVLEGWGLSIFEEGVEYNGPLKSKDVSSIPGLSAAASHQLSQVPGFAYPQGQPPPRFETALIEPAANYQLLEHSHPPSTSSIGLRLFSLLLLLVMLGGVGYFGFIQYKQGVFSQKPPDVNMQRYSQLREVNGTKAHTRGRALAGTPKQPEERRSLSPSTAKEPSSKDAGVVQAAIRADEPVSTVSGGEVLAVASTERTFGVEPIVAEEPPVRTQADAGVVDAGIAKPMLASAEATSKDAGSSLASPDSSVLAAGQTPDHSVAGGPSEERVDRVAPGGVGAETTQPDARPLALAPTEAAPDAGGQDLPDTVVPQPDSSVLAKAPKSKEGLPSLDGGTGSVNLPEAGAPSTIDAGAASGSTDAGHPDKNTLAVAPDSSPEPDAVSGTPEKEKPSPLSGTPDASPKQALQEPPLVAAVEPNLPDAGGSALVKAPTVPEVDPTPEAPSEARPTPAPIPRVARPTPPQPAGPREKVALVDAGPANPSVYDAGTPPESALVVIPDSSPTQVVVPENTLEAGPTSVFVPEKAPVVRPIPRRGLPPSPRRGLPPQKVASKTPCKADWIYIEVPKAWDDDTDVSVEKGKVVRKPKGFCIAPNSKRVLIEREEYAQCVFATPTTKTKWVVYLKREGLSLLEPNYCLKK